MDQVKIGKFIALCRKEKGLTQAALAEQMGITDRAVSKWENGKCMPDISILTELCGILGINVNELLSGEHIKMEDYQKTAENNLLELARQEEAANSRLLLLERIIGFTCTVSMLVLVIAAAVAVTSLVWQIVMMVAGFITFGIGIAACMRIEHDAGYYECPNCCKRYVPTMKAMVLAPHIGMNRRMKCPYCGKKGYHKKVLTK